MTIRIAINGFGRIGRCVFRHAIKDPRIEIVFINDLVAPEVMAYLLKYDSLHGVLPQKIHANAEYIYVDDKAYRIFAKKDPGQLPYKEHPVDFVVESTGFFTTMDSAKVHRDAGASRVVITAPSDAPMFVMGVNQHHYDPKIHTIVSNASCTTNCLAPLAKVLHEKFYIIEGLMTTVHATTASQTTVDVARPRDMRGSRSAMVNVIPSTTGAAKAVGKVIPDLAGKLTGMAFRVPVTNVSVVDLTVRVEKKTNLKEINQAMREASEGELKGILGYTEDPVVSTDFNGCELSSIYDATAGIELNSQFFKVVSWYDNEIGYSKRVLDFICYGASVRK